MNFLCICTYFKGVEFLKSCKAEGNKVFLLTNQKLKDKPWPWESIDEVFYLDNVDNNFDTYHKILTGLANLMRTVKIDRVVALDDFDVEKAALVREHFRIPGMGQTTARYFRDKLAMRVQAQDLGIAVPPFSPLFHDIDITEYLQRTPAPWVIKPRSEASAAGIKKVHSFQEAWDTIHALGEERHNFLIEQFKPGDVYHVDSLTINGKVIFTRCNQYLNTPFEVAHGGGIFRSVTVEHGSEDAKLLKKVNEDVMRAFGMRSSASHTEMIKCYEDGQFYFLETASRVGGANLAEMVEYSSGINLWKEWAKIETMIATGDTYELPKVEDYYSGIIISLSSYEHPDYTPFNDPEIVWKMNEEYHIGLIVRSESRAKVLELMEKYAIMIRDLGYHASAPAPDKPVH
ncbi:ATP-dependent carboxylate-amine ligase domain protein ATP-grasp [Emticicia oligotrophica DSM 17448]|uniref:ATP-dependent carboxylate-amine ligase domain protein ATP-grasp n=1 Tax=Emticicia oligotrophica (strain DSM 17448 / CIP 109782 / MTCC 6937 / GPTSA100-15) TaxID=929562 RepID=A0ABM5MZW4_EMTOG|nr:ATPase [Emticicia oligotrophica]AFK02553.1 ATP-dependent carboxylate-amine ligase domain protein ATP-grasp [Emticicia oligotrophica DSM 17448]